MTLSPNIVLGNDYVTAYFADQIWPKTLRDHRKRWDEAAKAGEPTPRSRLSGLSTAYFRTKPDAVDGDTDALAALCAQVTDALGYAVDFDVLGQPQPATVTFSRGDDLFDLPCLAAATDSADHPVLVAVAADTFTADPSLLVTGDAKPQHRLHHHGQPDATVDGSDTVPGLVNAVFATEHPPRWILVVAGGAVALLDHRPWLDGKWLGADIDDILSNSDRTGGGELDQLAGWFSTAGTIPGEDGTSLLDAAVDGSQRQAVGVSESLRDAVRAGVEAIANEVLYDRRERRKLSVFGERGGVTVDAPDLARQAIRWMYRLVVLLYAEARPGIGILPTTSDGTTLYERYEAGYGLERLRQLALVELESVAARNGTHIHQSLNLLFRLVNEGHQRPTAAEISADGADNWTGIEFGALNSRLFGPKSCPDIDAAQLRDHVLQKVMAGLCFTPGEKGKGPQAVSYANLEINQLGAVYEGLMAYTGFIALEDRNEVAARTKGDSKDGVARSADPSRGSWTIPTTEAARYPRDVFVTEKHPDTGEARPILHPKGSFVFRLAGRDRARSASFYTPSVLTEFTVRHALEEWQANHPDVTAADVLQVTILEPALGSGAFANEAGDQTAELYLRLREAETGETVPAEDRPTELRKLRAHFAINQTYGVDLNDTAVELAEVSLWLNSMHPGLSAPPLSHRLRRGNSLIGCTRATYTEDQVAKQPWKGDVIPPTDEPLSEHPLGTQGLGIHHFLLPGEGWGAAAKTGKGNPCRSLAPEWCDQVWDWRKQIHKKASKAQIARVKELANKIESLWAAAAVDVTAHLNAQSRRIVVWNEPGVSLPVGNSIRFLDPEGPYQRLKTIMDAWCALWMWAPEHGTALPALDQWFDCIDYLCGQRRADAEGRLFGEHTRIAAASLDNPGALFEVEVSFDDAISIVEATGRWPWLTHCMAIAARQAFFHWELDYVPVLVRGGFELQVGNPPWVRQRWNEDASLAELDPWWGLAVGATATPEMRGSRRSQLLLSQLNTAALLAEGAEHLGLVALLGASSRASLLGGVQTNLYLNFILTAARHVSPHGTVALIHPDDHLSDPAAGELRSFVIPRLRRHWQFANELHLFKEIGESKEYAIDVYSGTPRSPASFLQSSYLLHPATVDGSLRHDGSGPAPGVKHPEGDWDLRPHSARLLRVGEQVLGAWHRLTTGTNATNPTSARVLRPVTTHDQRALSQLAQAPLRLRDVHFEWSRGIDEDKLVRSGLAERSPYRPEHRSHLILQGPHIENGNYMAQESREIRRSNNDWDPVNLTRIGQDFLPRSGYRPIATELDLRDAYGGSSAAAGLERLREVHREFVAVDSPRTLQAALCPSLVLHINSVNSISLPSTAETVRWVGLLSSIPMDSLVKILGADHVNRTVAECLPIAGPDQTLDQELLGRVCWLTCLTVHFESVWNEIGRSQRVTSVLVDRPYPAAKPWDTLVPLRDDFSRWAVLCEIDGIVAHLFGLSEGDLVQLYRSNFGKLRSYEHSSVFDSCGRQVSAVSHAQSAQQREFETQLKSAPTKRGQEKLTLWERVEALRDGDSEVDLAYLVAPFRRADRELAMRTAYRAFAERSGKTEGVSREPLPEWEVWG